VKFYQLLGGGLKDVTVALGFDSERPAADVCNTSDIQRLRICSSNKSSSDAFHVLGSGVVPQYPTKDLMFVL
jgi:hypothetical protein